MSEDRRLAGRVARDLGLSLLEATVTRDELLEPLDTVLREGIDWRDFNVHAALVNAALARAIAGASESSDGIPLVFTGDLANEFLVDYEPESYRGETYYSLPRLPPAALRSLLVRGLDTCHREVGIFEAWALALVQPYAVAVDTYMRLPEAFLRAPDRKQRLSRAIFKGAMPSYVTARDKTRAQVGGARGGRRSRGLYRPGDRRRRPAAALRRAPWRLRRTVARSLPERGGTVRACPPAWGSLVNEGDVAARIESFVRETFDVAPEDPNFGRELDLFEYGYVDSVGLTELLAFIEEEFGVEAPDEELMSEEFVSIDGMARVIARLGGR